MKIVATLFLSLLLVMGTAPADAARRDPNPATRSEYNRALSGMSESQVARLFENRGRQIEHYPVGVLVSCADSRFFCGGEQVVNIGEWTKREYFTGRADRYNYNPGIRCYAIQITFIRDAFGTNRLRAKENFSNTCSTRSN